MKTEIIKAGKYTIKQFGSTHDIVLATIQLFVMIELTFSLGYIHNQLYPPFRSEEDICTTCQCVIMQSWSLVILFGVILFIQQLIKNLYPVKTSVSPWLFCVVINIVFIVVAQTQRSYYNRVKMIYKDGFSLISYLLKMMN